MSAVAKNDKCKGYRGPTLEVMQRFDVGVWFDVEVKGTNGSFRGIILPRSETSDADHLVLKMDSGYNVGIHYATIENIVQLGYREANYKIPEKEFPYSPDKPNVILLGTGGTIASRLDYRTGAVIPAFSPGELYGSVPELADICNLETKKLYGVFSENMGPEQYIGLAKAIGQAIADGKKGIIVGHGTDTMSHTAAILSFMVQNSPIPIVMVGSQRSSDRPSSDAALNLQNAATVACKSDIAETVVCMFGPTSDEYCLIHRGTRVRKMHSSYRSTFRTVGDIPLGSVNPQGVTTFREDYAHRREDRNVIIDPVFEEKVTIQYYYPNMNPDIFDALVDKGYKGIIIAGTGLGHVNRPLYQALRRATDAGVHMYMTVQTLWGYVQMYVYETGREIMDLGVIPAANMLPETAYMKLCWALGHSNDREEVKRIMLTPVAGEILEREPIDGYLIYQGGIPEVEEFFHSIHR